MINSTRHYKGMIDKNFSEYLKNFKCKFNIKKNSRKLYLYYCDKDINISRFKNLNMTFEFDYNDLFKFHDDI